MMILEGYVHQDTIAWRVPQILTAPLVRMALMVTGLVVLLKMIVLIAHLDRFVQGWL